MQLAGSEWRSGLCRLPLNLPEPQPARLSRGTTKNTYVAGLLGADCISACETLGAGPALGMLKTVADPPFTLENRDAGA